MKPDYWRQLDFFDPNSLTTIPTIVGAGSTGSFIAIGLAAMGIKQIRVIDFDMVDAHNLPNQFFAQTLLQNTASGQLSKVLALKATIDLLYPDTEIIPIHSKIEDIIVSEWTANCKIVFCCVDTIEARSYIINSLRPLTSRLLIDPRTGGEYYNVYSLVSASIYYNYYIDSLEGVSAPLRCTGTSIADVAFAVASTCIQRMRRFLKTNKMDIIHTFHDCSTGMVSFMKTTNETVDSNFIRTEENINAITGERREENANSEDSNQSQDIL